MWGGRAGFLLFFLVILKARESAHGKVTTARPVPPPPPLPKVVVQPPTPPSVPPKTPSPFRSLAKVPELNTILHGNNADKFAGRSIIGALAPEYQNSRVSRPHILFVSAALRGHATPLIRLMQELETRDKFRLTFATHLSGKDWLRGSSSSFASLGKFPIPASSMRAMLARISKEQSKLDSLKTMFNELYLPLLSPMYQTLSSIVARDMPALLVADIASIAAIAIADKFDIPLVINNPSLPFGYDGESIWMPAWGSGFPLDMSSRQRFENFFFSRMLAVSLNPAIVTINRMRWNIGVETFLGHYDMLRNVRVIENSAPGFDYARRVGPLVTQVGPIMPTVPIKSCSPPPPGMRRWFEQTGSWSAVVYVSFGWMTQVEPWQAMALVNGLSDAKLRVLWTMPNAQRGLLPATLPPSFRVKSLGSVPHFTVLGHSAVRVVVSHCGTSAAQEALYFGKPLLCLPFFGEQPGVAQRVAKLGAGLILDKESFSVAEVREKVFSLFEGSSGSGAGNNSFSKAAFAASVALRAAGGAQAAADVVEEAYFVGTSHKIGYLDNHPWHQRQQIDVALVYLSIVLLFGVGYIVFISCVSNIFRGKGYLAAMPKPAGNRQRARPQQRDVGGQEYAEVRKKVDGKIGVVLIEVIPQSSRQGKQ
eukprot:g5097.t1